MKEKVKQLFKSNILYFALAIFMIGTIGVSAVTYFPSNQVTYDNSSSKLNSTNVQGALDELYAKCKTCTSGGTDSSRDYIYYAKDNGSFSWIYRVSINGGQVVQIGEKEYNTITGIGVSGNYIYYAAENNSFGFIYKMSINGGNLTQLARLDNVHITNLKVSGNYIYFGANNNSFGIIYKLSINGGNPTQLARDSASISSIA